MLKTRTGVKYDLCIINNLIEPELHLLQTQAGVKYDFNMHVKYRLQVLQAEMSRLAKTEECASVMANPVSFWRSQAYTSTNFTADIDLQRLTIADKYVIQSMV